MHRTRLLAVAAALATVANTAACESCDFSFGPVPVTVNLAPADRAATATLCSETSGCETAAVGAGDTGRADQADFYVSWWGYAVCKVPKLDLTVTADGCRTYTESRDRVGQDGAPVVFDVALDCG